MSQYKAIPQPTDQRNVSQNDILTNYQYLSTPLNPTAGVPPGILPVDHFASGDNVANPTDGFHKQASFQDRASPANLTNAINGQPSSGILYSKADAQPTSQLRYLNSIIDSPLTYLKAAVLFQNNGTILGNSFNIASVVKTIATTGDYTITFTVPMLNINYMVLSNATLSSGTALIMNYGTKTTADFHVFSTSPLGVSTNISQATVLVFGLF